MRRLSFVMGEMPDSEIDEAFKGLYPSSEVIERRCTESVLDKNSLSVSSDLASKLRPIHPNKISYDKSFKEVIDELPDSYFSMQYDPVAEHLEEISSWIDDETIEKFMAKIEETDTDKDIIIGEITSMIDANYDDLMSCMRKIQEISYELKSATGSVNFTREKISSAKRFILNGALRAKNLSVRKQKLRSVLESTSNLKKIQLIYSQMQEKMYGDEVGDAAEQCLILYDQLKTDTRTEFLALRNIREGYVHSLTKIKNKTDKYLNRLVCRRFSTVDYDRIMKSYLILDYISSQVKISAIESSQEDMDITPIVSVLESLPKLVSHYQFLDIESCLIAAVVENVFQTQQKKQRRASEIQLTSSDSFFMNGDVAEMPLNVVYKRVSPDLLPQCIVRSCEMLADILHTHFLITQWHFAPFSDLNNDWNYLNGKKVEVNEDINGKPESNDSEEVELQIAFQTLDISTKILISKSLEHYLSTETYSTLYFNNETTASDLTTKFLSISHKMIQCKTMLWEEVSRGLITILKAVNFSFEVKLDEFVLMMTTLKSFIDVGRQFCGSNSIKLSEFLQEKSTKYFMTYHAEGIQMLKEMFEAELWQSISVGSSAADNTCDVILKTLLKETKKFVDDTPPAEQIDPLSGVPNPFQSPLKIAKSPMNRRRSGNGTGFGLIEERLGNTATKKAKNSLIVTQSSWNGVVKPVFRYLDILSSMPTNSGDVMDCMSQLFDFYLCAVFHCFVPTDERGRLLAPPAKMTASPPDLNREFQVMNRLFFDSIIYVHLDYAGVYG
jgi:hypothetical protein